MPDFAGGAIKAHRDALVEKRREVTAQLGMQVDALALASRVGEEDQAQVSHAESVSLRLNRLEWDTLKLIEEALDRLDTGDFGICQRCEEPIAARRLAVLPWAKYCVRCQEKVARRAAEGHSANAAAPTPVWSA